MMRAWGIDTHGFTGFTFLTNVWDTGSKLLLPILGVVVLTRAGETVTPTLRDALLSQRTGPAHCTRPSVDGSARAGNAPGPFVICASLH